MSTDLLYQAYRAWNASAPLRSRRQRYKRYTYGDQWSDLVRDSKGRLCREEQLISASGVRPAINNLIRQLVKSIVGRFRSLAGEGTLYDGPATALADANMLPELDSRLLEEFLISGCAIQAIDAGERHGKHGVWVDNVDLEHFFVNKFRDPRGWDIELAGRLHDLSYPELVRRFGRGSRRRAADLRKIFSGTPAAFAEGITTLAAGDSFFGCDEAARCRVIELWTQDWRPRGKGDSLVSDITWHCRWLAPDGTILDEYDSPYAHGSHPFVIKFYPLTDGEVHSFVEDIIDQQRSINRIIAMIDRMTACSAKGVLLFPNRQRVEGFSWEEITERWAKSDGVIPISGEGQFLPQQVHTNPAAGGAYQLLELQMRLFDDISGVGGAILGRTTDAKGAEMFDSQVRSATIALADIFETFISLLEQRNAKALEIAK